MIETTSHVALSRFEHSLFEGLGNCFELRISDFEFPFR